MHGGIFFLVHVAYQLYCGINHKVYVNKFVPKKAFAHENK